MSASKSRVLRLPCIARACATWETCSSTRVSMVHRRLFCDRQPTRRDERRISLQGGMIGYLDVVDAERSLLQAERSCVQNLGSRNIATVQLIKALGGGWGSQSTRPVEQVRCLVGTDVSTPKNEEQRPAGMLSNSRGNVWNLLVNLRGKS